MGIYGVWGFGVYGGVADIFPRNERTMSLEWWELLADLGFLRFNYRHFNHASLPGWCRGHALLAERIDCIVSMTRALHAQASE